MIRIIGVLRKFGRNCCTTFYNMHNVHRNVCTWYNNDTCVGMTFEKRYCNNGKPIGGGMVVTWEGRAAAVG